MKSFPSLFSSIKRNFSVILLVSSVMACVLIFATQSERRFLKTIEGNSNLPITSDGSGYYAYLPATFIYKDYKFEFLHDVYGKYHDFNYINGTNFGAGEHDIKDKYYIGTAVLMSPFFLGNCLLNQFTKGNFGDGYEKSFQKAMRFSVLFYYLLGIIGVILFLKTFSISNYRISLLVFALSLGTSLNFYTVYFPAFSHVYSFCAIAWFFYLSRKFAQETKRKYLIYLFLLAGLIAIIRPTNILVVMIFPFLFPNWKAFLHTIKGLFQSSKLILMMGFLLFLGVIFLQILNVYLQTNSFNPNSYTQEKFEFLSNPKMFDVLFSYRKGLFVYAPLFFLIFPGLFVLYRKNKYLFWGWILVFFANLYVISAWWCWWYGGGLGMRPFVDLSILLIIPIAYLLQYSLKWIQFVTIGPILFAIYAYHIFQIQYISNILHYDIVTPKSFWQSFLDPSGRFSWQVFFENESLPPGKLNAKTSLYYHPNTKSWQDHKGPSTVSFGKQGQDLDIHYTFLPDSTLHDSIAFRIKADLWIAKGETSPGFLINYFKDGEQIFKKDFYMGCRIPKLFEFTPINLTINPHLSSTQVDSIQLFFTRNIQPTAVKNLEINYLLFEAK